MSATSTSIFLESEPSMIHTRIQKQNDSFFVVIPDEAMEEYDLHEGDQVAFQPTKLETRAILPPELQKAFDESWERNEEGYRYLADR